VWRGPLKDRARAKLLAGDRGWRYVAARLEDLGARLRRPLDASTLNAELARIGASTVRHPGNLRYGFRLHRSVRFGLPAAPYPKRGAP